MAADTLMAAHMVTGKSDIFQLGLLVQELMFLKLGRDVLDQHRRDQLAAARLAGRPSVFSQPPGWTGTPYSATLVDLTTSCLTIHPDQRPEIRDIVVQCRNELDRLGHQTLAGAIANADTMTTHQMTAPLDPNVTVMGAVKAP